MWTRYGASCLEVRAPTPRCGAARHQTSGRILVTAFKSRVITNQQLAKNGASRSFRRRDESSVICHGLMGSRQPQLLQHRLRGAAELALEVGAVVDAHVVGVRVLHLVDGRVELERRRPAAAARLVEAGAVGRGDEVDDRAVVCAPRTRSTKGVGPHAMRSDVGGLGG